MAATFLMHGGGGGSFLKLKKQSHPILGLRPLPSPAANNYIKFNSLNYKKNHDSTGSLPHSNKPITLILNTKSSGNQQPLQAINFWENTLVKRALRKSAVAALLVLGLLVINKPNCALASPMGRVGGSWSVVGYSSSLNRDVEQEGHEDPANALLLGYKLLSLFFFASLGWNALFEGNEIGQIGYRGFLVLIGIWLIPGVAVYNFCHCRVARIQVCMSDRGGLLQSDLNRIAETADTSSHKGLNFVLDETLLALLRHQRSYLSHTSSQFTKFLSKPAKRYMEVLSSNERMFNEETLVNFNNMKSKSSPSAIESHNDQITVTILLTFGSGIPVHLPSKDDSDALMKWMKSRLESEEKLLAVEVLWTPQVSSSAANWQTVLNYPSQSEVPHV